MKLPSKLLRKLNEKMTIKANYYKVNKYYNDLNFSLTPYDE